jgi:hypothetical protein
MIIRDSAITTTITITIIDFFFMVIHFIIITIIMEKFIKIIV